MKIDVNEVLSQLAKSFNIAVEELYPILYRQAIIDGIFDLFCTLFFIVGIGVFIYLLKLISKKQKSSICGHEWDWDEPIAILTIAVGSTFTLIGLFLIPMCLHSSLTAFFNTDYYIIENILSKIK